MKALDENNHRRVRKLEEFRDGRDEMNLAELPLAAITDRFLNGEKTVVFVDKVENEEKGGFANRNLSISGSDLYGLPTAKDDDVLLACIQLSSLGDFRSREVEFSRYELLKLLRWPDEAKYYRRLSKSLRRWKGVTIYSNRAFYDHEQKSWVNRDFGVFDNLYIYELEERDRCKAPAKSRFLWNEVLFGSFQAGYLKKLDWELYLSLQDPVAKRLYRLLDKRFYWNGTVSFDLHELAFNKVRVSRKYNTAQIKRALMSGIRELEAVWELKALAPEERFRKLQRGKWEAVFVRRKKRARISGKTCDGNKLVKLLTERGVSANMARRLVEDYSQNRIEQGVEFFDSYHRQGKAHGPGLLVSAIQSEEEFGRPKGFQPSGQNTSSIVATNSRKHRGREIQEESATKRSLEEKMAEKAFLAFWERLSEDKQREFEARALETADSTKRNGYHRLQNVGGIVFEQYRRIILQDHFNCAVRPSHRDADQLKRTRKAESRLGLGKNTSEKSAA